MSGSVTDDLDIIAKDQEEKTDLAYASELLLNEKWKRRKTYLRSRSIPKLATLETIAVLYDVEWLREWIDDYTEYQTSIEGKGRKDIVDIAKSGFEKKLAHEKEIAGILGRR